MSTVLLVVHLLVAIFLVALILLQRSGGGALDGLGGGSGAGNFLTARGTGNLLTRLTAIMATLFFSDQPVAFPLLQGSRQHRRPVHSRQAGGGSFRPRRSGACRTGGSCGTERSGGGKINARQCNN